MQMFNIFDETKLQFYAMKIKREQKTYTHAVSCAAANLFLQTKFARERERERASATSQAILLHQICLYKYKYTDSKKMYEVYKITTKSRHDQSFRRTQLLQNVDIQCRLISVSFHSAYQLNILTVGTIAMRQRDDGKLPTRLRICTLPNSFVSFVLVHFFWRVHIHNTTLSPYVRKTRIEFTRTNRHIILTMDFIFRGQSIFSYALNATLSFQCSARILCL